MMLCYSVIFFSNYKAPSMSDFYKIMLNISEYF